MICGTVKVEASVISRDRRPRLITLAKTLIIPDITKPSSIVVLLYIVLWKMCDMQLDFICAYKNTRKNAPRGRITRNHAGASAL